MSYILTGLAMLVVLHIYYRIGKAFEAIEVTMKALDAHLKTGLDYREDISVAKDHDLVRYVLGQQEGYIEQLGLEANKPDGKSAYSQIYSKYLPTDPDTTFPANDKGE